MAKLKSETLDKHGVPTDIGDIIIYGLRTKQIAVVTGMKGKMLRVNDVHTDSGNISDHDRGKNPKLIINLIKIPSIFSVLLKNMIGPLRGLSDEQLENLSKMMGSSDKESANLAYSLIETYKEQCNENENSSTNNA